MGEVRGSKEGRGRFGRVRRGVGRGRRGELEGSGGGVRREGE